MVDQLATKDISISYHLISPIQNATIDYKAQLAEKKNQTILALSEIVYNSIDSVYFKFYFNLYIVSYIGLGEQNFWANKCYYFLTHQFKVLLSTHNICFAWEIRKHFFSNMHSYLKACVYSLHAEKFCMLASLLLIFFQKYTLLF